MAQNRQKADNQPKKNTRQSRNEYFVKGWGKLKLVEQDDSKYVRNSNYQSFYGVEDPKDIVYKPREPLKYVKDPDYQNKGLQEKRQQALIDFAEADKNVNYPTPTPEEIAKVKRQQAIIDFAEADKSVSYPTPSEIKGNERLKSFYANLKAEQETERIINERKQKDSELNSAEAKAKRASNEQRLENLYKETGFVSPSSSDNAYNDNARSKDLEKRLSAIENNESVKKTLNYTTRSDGTMSRSSKKDYESAQKFINDQEAEYVKTYTERFSNDAKYKLDEKISGFVNNEDWKIEFGKMGAQDKSNLMSNLTEAQINFVKKQNLELDNIANWSEDQMERVVKGLKEAEYMNDVKENLTKEFREGVKQRANLAGYNKIASRESSVASEMSKKMSGFKSVGKMAIGGALMYSLVSALSDSGGQQSNAQLYGQQPLY